MISAGLTLDREDVRDIIKRMQALDEYVQKKVSRNTIKAITKVVAANAKAAAPVRSGNLKRSIFVMKIRTRTQVVSGRVAFYRGGKGGRTGKASEASAPYAMFLEFGSRSYRKKVHGHRRSKRRDLWKHWWRASIIKNERLFISELDLQMDKTLRLMAKRSSAARRR